MISLSIDVSKINKDRLFKGKSGTYLDAVLIPTPDNQYGNDYMIVESISKEEREAGNKGTILGNAKIIKKRTEEPQENKVAPAGNDSFKGGDDNDDLPF